MLKKILHRYIVIENDIKMMSDWIDVSNLTLAQVEKISKDLDMKYKNN